MFCLFMVFPKAVLFCVVLQGFVRFFKVLQGLPSFLEVLRGFYDVLWVFPWCFSRVFRFFQTAKGHLTKSPRTFETSKEQSKNHQTPVENHQKPVENQSKSRIKSMQHLAKPSKTPLEKPSKNLWKTSNNHHQKKTKKKNSPGTTAATNSADPSKKKATFAGLEENRTAWGVFCLCFC